jgi:hypothetical protein
MKKRVTYGIYLPNDNEKWFKTTFTSKRRAHWYAEQNDLGADDYEVRDTSIVLEERTVAA